MIKQFALSSLFVLLIGTTWGQTTTVTATVVDTTSTAWANGTYQISFLPNPSKPNAATYTLNNATFTQNFSGTLSGSGGLSVVLADNNIVVPAGSQWSFTICPQVTSNCVTLPLVITGTSQNVSSAINALLTNTPVVAAPAIATAYNSAEVGMVPNRMYLNVTNNTLYYINNSGTVVPVSSPIVDITDVAGVSLTANVPFWTVGPDPWYSFKGNGLTGSYAGDDTAKFQTLIANTPDGATWYTEQGIYNISAPLLVSHKDIKWVCAGGVGAFGGPPAGCQIRAVGTANWAWQITGISEATAASCSGISGISSGTCNIATVTTTANASGTHCCGTGNPLQQGMAVGIHGTYSTGSEPAAFEANSAVIISTPTADTFTYIMKAANQGSATVGVNAFVRAKVITFGSTTPYSGSTNIQSVDIQNIFGKDCTSENYSTTTCTQIGIVINGNASNSYTLTSNNGQIMTYGGAGSLVAHAYANDYACYGNECHVVQDNSTTQLFFGHSWQENAGSYSLILYPPSLTGGFIATVNMNGGTLTNLGATTFREGDVYDCTGMNPAGNITAGTWCQWPLILRANFIQNKRGVVGAGNSSGITLSGGEIQSANGGNNIDFSCAYCLATDENSKANGEQFMFGTHLNTTDTQLFALGIGASTFIGKTEETGNNIGQDLLWYGSGITATSGSNHVTGFSNLYPNALYGLPLAINGVEVHTVLGNSTTDVYLADNVGSSLGCTTNCSAKITQTGVLFDGDPGSISTDDPNYNTKGRIVNATVVNLGPTLGTYVGNNMSQVTLNNPAVSSCTYTSGFMTFGSCGAWHIGPLALSSTTIQGLAADVTNVLTGQPTLNYTASTTQLTNLTLGAPVNGTGGQLSTWSFQFTQGASGSNRKIWLTASNDSYIPSPKSYLNGNCLTSFNTDTTFGQGVCLSHALADYVTPQAGVILPVGAATIIGGGAGCSGQAAPCSKAAATIPDPSNYQGIKAVVNFHCASVCNADNKTASWVFSDGTHTCTVTLPATAATTTTADTSIITVMQSTSTTANLMNVEKYAWNGTEIAIPNSSINKNCSSTGLVWASTGLSISFEMVSDGGGAGASTIVLDNFQVYNNL